MSILEKELIKKLADAVIDFEIKAKEVESLEKINKEFAHEIKVLRGTIDAKNNLNEKLTDKISELESQIEI